MTFSPKIRTRLILASAAAYWLIIFAGTHVPGHVLYHIGHKDKVFHFGAFVGLSALLCGAVSCFRKPGPAVYAAVFAVAAVYGVFDELTQQLVPLRTADPLDWLADICGAAIGVLAFAGAHRLFAQRSIQA